MGPKKVDVQPLKNETQHYLKDILLCISKYEQELEVLRMFLGSNEMFEPYAAFCRIDRNQDGFISPMEFVNFFRDNGITKVTEAECYFVLKYWDSDEDGKLHYPDFLQIVLPCT